MTDPQGFPTEIAGIPVRSERAITAALNDACDEIADAAELPDTGTRDALNLLVNTALHRLFTNPHAELDEVIEANYDIDTDDDDDRSPQQVVLGWIND